MKVRISLLTVVAGMLMLAPSARAEAQNDDLQATLEATERSLWEAWKTGDWDVFRTNLIENAVNSGERGVMVGRDAMIEGMEAAPCEVESYSLSDFQVHRVADGTAILTYRGEQVGSCEGEALSSPVRASAVYVRTEDGAWKNAFYQETPMP